MTHAAARAAADPLFTPRATRKTAMLAGTCVWSNAAIDPSAPRFATLWEPVCGAPVDRNLHASWCPACYRRAWSPSQGSGTAASASGDTLDVAFGD